MNNIVERLNKAINGVVVNDEYCVDWHYGGGKELFDTANMAMDEITRKDAQIKEAVAILTNGSEYAKALNHTQGDAMSNYSILNPRNFNTQDHKYDLPKCEARISPQSVKYRVGNSDVCNDTASVAILGKNYCKKHGGMVLLELLADGKLSIET